MQGYFSDRQADDVYDELYAKALVLQNEDTAIAIVVCDIIGTYREYLDMAKARASEMTGIPATASSSPAPIRTMAHTLQLARLPMETEYTEWAMERTADAVRLAYNRLQPARVGHASGSCPEETHNRRWHMADGTVRQTRAIRIPTWCALPALRIRRWQSQSCSMTPTVRLPLCATTLCTMWAAPRPQRCQPTTSVHSDGPCNGWRAVISCDHGKRLLWRHQQQRLDTPRTALATPTLPGRARRQSSGISCIRSLAADTRLRFDAHPGSTGPDCGLPPPTPGRRRIGVRAEAV